MIMEILTGSGGILSYLQYILGGGGGGGGRILSSSTKKSGGDSVRGGGDFVLHSVILQCHSDKGLKSENG